MEVVDLDWHKVVLEMDHLLIALDDVQVVVLNQLRVVIAMSEVHALSLIVDLANLLVIAVNELRVVVARYEVHAHLSLVDLVHS